MMKIETESMNSTRGSFRGRVLRRFLAMPVAAEADRDRSKVEVPTVHGHRHPARPRMDKCQARGGSAGRVGLDAAAEGLEIQGDRAADLRGHHRLERPVAER